MCKEYIERETAVLSLLDKGQHSRRYKLGEIWELDFEEIREAINSIPAADVRPVVTCGECKHWFENGSDYCSCDRDALLRERNLFCAEGKKREKS